MPACRSTFPTCARVVSAFITCACVYGHAGAQAPVVRDSAGVRIVQNPARARAPVVFQLGAKPVVDLGGPEEPTDNEFNPQQGYLRAARLSDGGFAVIDVARVHFFDPKGKRLRIVGRTGGGPGEFRYLMMVCRTRGDTIVLSDSHNKRFAILDRSGTVVREFPQGEPGVPPFDACLGDGTVVLQRVMPVASPTRPTRINRISLDGSLVNPVGEFPFRSFDMVTQSSATMIGWNDRIYAGDGSTSEVRVYTPAGKLSMIIRSADALDRITDAEAEERMRSTIPRGTSGTEVNARMDRMRSLPHAANWPAYRGLHVDPNGTLWVQDYARKYPSPDAWTAFDRDGRLIGRLVIPAPKQGERRMEIISFESDGLLVRRSDEDGFAHLTVFPIQRIGRR